MPKKARSRPKIKPNNFVLWIESRTGKLHGVLYKDLAELLGITSASFSSRMKTGKFDYSEIVKIFDFLNATDRERLEVMKGGE